MKNVIKISAIVLAVFMLSSCDQDDIDDVLGGNNGLSNTDVVNGLKEALNEGTDASTSILSLQDGYYKDELVKILLPDEIETAINGFKNTGKSINVGFTTINLTGEQLYNGYDNALLGINIPGIKAKEDSLIKGLNRAAEFAAATAGPVFKSAITGMTVTDGIDILNGADTAATKFLKDNTYNELFNNYEPIVDNALNKVVVAGTPVATLYEDYINSYNDILTTDVLGNSVSSLFSTDTVKATNLSVYGTDRALDGLFLKVQDEEKNIRANPFAYASEIIQKVFGSLFD